MADNESILQDILDAPDGPEIGALFDFDGTIINGYSAAALYKDKIKKREISVGDFVQSLGVMSKYSRGKIGFSGMMAESVKAMKGIKEDDYIEYGEELYKNYIGRKVYTEARELIAAHQAKGHTVAVISSATVYQVGPTARDLDIEHVFCSEYEIEDGEFTGNIIRPLCFGEGKVIAAQKLVKDKGIDLDKSFFYSDSDDDIELLEAVGHPRPVNPNKKLSKIARKRGWPAVAFASGKTKPSTYVRSYYANMSMIGSLAAGIPIKMLTGSQQEASNFTTSLYGDITSALAGMTLDINGEEHAWSHRPAIFMFNHQSAVDPIIVAKIVRKDMGGVGKKEVGDIPILGKMMRNMGTVFVDRSNARSAIESMVPLVDALKVDKKSIVIAPEGTRSVSKKLGPFKKGAFHLALQAGVPVVPIVIHNAIDVQPSGKYLMRAATVKVDILPPVDTSKWTRRTLNTHVRDVRNMFLRTLGQAEEIAPKPVKAKPKTTAKKSPKKTVAKASKAKPQSKTKT